MHPVSLDFVADPAELAVAVVQGEVLVETAQHRREMTLLFASLPMPVHLQPLTDASEKLPAAFGAGDADEGKAPVPIHPTDMLEAEELKGLRPSMSISLLCFSRKAPKEQQPSLVLGQLQIELRKTFPQLVLEHLRIIPELKAPNEVISETHQVRLAMAL